MIKDESINAIYNPLPNAKHCEWMIKALKAGKHILCEKPFALNASEAELMKKAAEERPHLVLMEVQDRFQLKDN
jgi:xylose dehydrogenase (NAD/NADP)